MASRDRDRGRKYLSGAEKLKRQPDDYIKRPTNNILKCVIGTTSHSTQLDQGEEHMAVNQIPLEDENQELNTSVQEHEEDTNETELDKNGNNRKIVKLIKKKILKIWKLKHNKKKTEISTLKILACDQLTGHNKQ